MESTERSEPMSPYDRVKEIDIEKESGRLSSDVTLDGEGETQAAPVDDREAGPDGGQIQPAVSKFSVNNVSSIPNGGLRAWLQVAGTFFLFFNTWSVVFGGQGCCSGCTVLIRFHTKCRLLILPQGNLEYLWCLSDILRNWRAFPRLILHHLLDWLRTSLPCPPRWHTQWSHIRCRLRLLIALGGIYRRCLRTDDAKSLPRVLPSAAGPSICYWYWRRLFVHSRCRNIVDVFQLKNCFRGGDCRFWKQSRYGLTYGYILKVKRLTVSRRRDLPDCLPPAPNFNRFRVDYPRPRFYDARDPRRAPCRHESACSACSEAKTCGLVGFHRGTLRLLRHWSGHHLYGSIYTFLLHPVLQHSGAHHRYESRLLSPRHSQHGLDSWSNLTEFHRRQGRPFQRNSSLRCYIWRPHFRPHWHSQRRQHHCYLHSVRFLFWVLCVAPAHVLRLAFTE